MIGYCLITGENYLAKAFVLINSLKIQSRNDFKLYYFCFDDKTLHFLKKLTSINKEYNFIIPIGLNQVIDTYPVIRKLALERTSQELYFTLTPFIIEYVLKKFKAEICIYLDADLVFYKDPETLIYEMGQSSILITPHNFSPEFEYLKYTGNFCVQFNPFKNSSDSFTVLDWWKQKCSDWCFLRQEDGKWGDQGYLNVWPSLFKGLVKVCDNEGAGVAPWNILKLKLNADAMKVNNIYTYKSFDIVFYHFQGLKKFFGLFYFISPTKKSREYIEKLYKPYIRELKTMERELRRVDSTINPISNFYSLQYVSLLLKEIYKRNIYLG